MYPSSTKRLNQLGHWPRDTWLQRRLAWLRTRGEAQATPVDSREN